MADIVILSQSEEQRFPKLERKTPSGLCIGCIADTAQTGGGISHRRISLRGNLLRKKSPYREIFLGRNLLIGKSSRDKTLVTGKYLTELLYRFFSLNSFFILANSFCQSWNEEIGDRRGGRRQRRK